RRQLRSTVSELLQPTEDELARRDDLVPRPISCCGEGIAWERAAIEDDAGASACPRTEDQREEDLTWLGEGVLGVRARSRALLAPRGDQHVRERAALRQRRPDRRGGCAGREGSTRTQRAVAEAHPRVIDG